MDPDNIVEIVKLGLPAYALKQLADPTLKGIGDEIWKFNSRLTKRSVKNLSRIFSTAEDRLGDRRNGGDVGDHVNDKALYQIIENGMLASDELSADYFGGLLTSSWSEDTRDDRGASYARLIGGLSSYEIRAHYLIYRGILETIQTSGATITLDHVRSAMTIFAPWDAVLDAMDFRHHEDPNMLVGHALTGLSRSGLVDSYFAWGKQDTLQNLWSAAPSDGIVVAPSAYGAEVFMWALGMGQLPLEKFSSMDLAWAQFPGVRDFDGVQLTREEAFIAALTGDSEMPSGFEDKRSARYAEDL